MLSNFFYLYYIYNIHLALTKVYEHYININQEKLNYDDKKTLYFIAFFDIIRYFKL